MWKNFCELYQCLKNLQHDNMQLCHHLKKKYENNAVFIVLSSHNAFCAKSKTKIKIYKKKTKEKEKKDTNSLYSEGGGTTARALH